MKLFQMHPKDSAWLRRWLRSNLSFFVVAVTLVIAVRFQPDMPTAPQVVADEQPVASKMQPPDFEPDFEPVVEPVVDHGERPRAVAPTGWRRTRNGWEHVSTWRSIGKTINQIIADQREQEPAWARVTFARLRRISPLMLALIQITAIAAIVNVSRARQNAA